MRISDWSSDVCSSDLKDPTYIVKPPAMKVRKATHRIATIVGQRPASLISTGSRDSREERCDCVAVLIVICAQLPTQSFNRRETVAPHSFRRSPEIGRAHV